MRNILNTSYMLHCKFPVAGRGLGLMVCGAPCQEGSPYCPDCHRKAHITRPLKRINSGPTGSIPAPVDTEEEPGVSFEVEG